MTSMIVHDTRLNGRTPLNYNFVMIVDGTRSIDEMVKVVASRARNRGHLDALHLFCHGYESHSNLGEQMSTPDAHGGFGLHICKEGLTFATVRKTTAWKGIVRRIVVYACAPADTAAGNEGTRGDGQRLCGELALWSGAEVIAARDTQYYHRVDAHYSGGRTVGNTIDFGAWEGPVYSFAGNTGYPTPIAPGSFDMSHPTSL
jgi:hypothetical protein